eukprot:GEMP01020608.1.p1 GENE.GEMP01020608.1~~GEMP01020608.1.p1  ORF type:complete len:811 (+),score=175.03 GEMP01020608.1:48-2480(+)
MSVLVSNEKNDIPMTAQPIGRGDAIPIDVNNLTVQEGLDLIERTQVDPLRKYLRTGVFEKSNLSFMAAYSVVVHFGDCPNESNEVYAYYKRVIRDYCRDGAPTTTGVEMLSAVANLWEKATILIYWMQRVFQYLDRFFIDSNFCYSSISEVPGLYATALLLFEREVYAERDRDIEGSLLAAIDLQRDDDSDVDIGVFQKHVEMLTLMSGSVDPQRSMLQSNTTVSITKIKSAKGDALRWHSTSSEGRFPQFERAFLDAARAYYRVKASPLLGGPTTTSVPTYLRTVNRWIEAEMERARAFNMTSTAEPVKCALLQELVETVGADLAANATSGVHVLMDNCMEEDLRLTYELFRQCAQSALLLQAMAAELRRYFDAALASTMMGGDDAIQGVTRLLETKVRFDGVLRRCFDGERVFLKMRNDALESYINVDSKLPRPLSVFCDALFRGRCKHLGSLVRDEKTDDDALAVIPQIIDLFVLLNDKDMFLELYRHSLSRRLLGRVTSSMDTERHFVQKLTMECGLTNTQSLSTMLKDITMSGELHSAYKQLPHEGFPGGVALEVVVLQTNAWPERGDPHRPTIPPALIHCQQDYNKFYHSKHNGRKLRWMYNLGDVMLITYCFPRKHLIVGTTYQGTILMLFNHQHSLTMQYISSLTNIPLSECQRQVISLIAAKHKILILSSTSGPQSPSLSSPSKDGNLKGLTGEAVLEVNTSFTSEKMKVHVSSVVKKTEKSGEVAEVPPVDRRHIIDATIVRIMKARKRLSHVAIIDEVLQRCIMFKPQPALIKAQIEHLIERDFLQRDAGAPNVYLYVP